MAAVNAQQTNASAATATQSSLPPSQHAPSLRSSVKPRKTGYYALAELMAPERGYAQFKRFAELNAHSLLIQQAELLDLEARLHVIADFDDEEGLNYSRNIEGMIDAAEEGRPSEQWKLILRIREKLKEYSN